MTETKWSENDPHAKAAAQIFGVPLQDVTEEMRRAAKTINFGVTYGSSLKNINMPKMEESTAKVVEIYSAALAKAKKLDKAAAIIGYLLECLYSVKYDKTSLKQAEDFWQDITHQK